MKSLCYFEVSLKTLHVAVRNWDLAVDFPASQAADMLGF